ncbi:MAG: hypothetical protein FWH11_04440 [Micrococcales bacterium]|nr:hypothetical protein [Micrococcales bacterium]
MSSTFVSAETLAGLLAARDDEGSVRAATIVADLDPDLQIRLGTQPAGRTAVTFSIKYEAARERGVVVLGLEQLVDHLTALSDSEIRACVVEGRNDFVLVVLDYNLSRVECVLHVITGEGRSD